MKLLRMGSKALGAGSRAKLATLALLACALFVAPASASAAPLSIKVEGNHFVDGEGQTIRLLGVDRTSSEYGCVDGFGYDDGHYDDADAAAIAGWNADAVRVPLNEDCWLGINGQPNSDEGAEPPLTVAGYRQEIESYVADLNAHGIYAILDLHWTAPGDQPALEQQPMPDLDHSPAFWTSVAGTFKSDPGVVFDVFNEPYDPTDPRSGSDGNSSDKVTWECWDTGTKPDLVGGGAPNEPCFTQAYDENEDPTTHYKIAGMQTLVDAIRATGATQPVMVGGLDYADDLSQWAEHAPDDPLNQEAASFHNYMGKECDNVSCWNSEVAPVAAAVPVVTGEFAEDNFENPSCGNRNPNSFDEEYMDWADTHGVSYLAWAWIVESPAEIQSDKCSAFYLIGDYSGTPASVNGIAVHAHLLSLPPGGRSTFPPVTPAPGGGGGGGAPKSAGPKIKLLRFRPKVMPGGKVSFQLEAATSCQAAISGQTVKAYKLGGHKPHKIALGSGKLGLTANKPATLTIKLSAKGLQLLRSQGSFKARFTVTLSGGGNATTVVPHIVTLEEPKPKAHQRH
jgi:endoglucanase